MSMGVLGARSCPCPIEFVGVKDTFGESGDPEKLAEKYGLAPVSIAAAVRRVMDRVGKASYVFKR